MGSRINVKRNVGWVMRCLLRFAILWVVVGAAYYGLFAGVAVGFADGPIGFLSIVLWVPLAAFFAPVFLLGWLPFLLPGLGIYLLALRTLPFRERRQRVAAILMSPLTVAGLVGYLYVTHELDGLVPGLFIGAAIFGATVRPYSGVVERELPVVREPGDADADEAQRTRSVA